MAEKAGISLVDTSKDTAQVQVESAVPMVEGQQVMTPVSPFTTPTV